MTTRTRRSALLGMLMALAFRSAAAREAMEETQTLALRADHMVLDAVVVGDRLLVGTQSGRVDVYHRRTGERLSPLLVTEAPDGARFAPTVHSLAVSPSGRRLAVATSDGRLRVLDLAAEGVPTLVERPVPALMETAWVGDERLLLGDMRGELALLDLETGRELYRRQLDYDPVHAFAASPSGRRVAVAFRSSRIQVIDPASGATQQELTGHRDAVFGLAWLDEQVLVSGGKDKRLMRWDLADTKPRSLVLYHGDHYITALGADPASDRLALSVADNRIGILRASDGRLERTLEGHTAPVQVVRFLDGGRTLLSAGFDARIFFWSLSAADRTNGRKASP